MWHTELYSKANPKTFYSCQKIILKLSKIGPWVVVTAKYYSEYDKLLSKIVDNLWNKSGFKVQI